MQKLAETRALDHLGEVLVFAHACRGKRTVQVYIQLISFMKLEETLLGEDWSVILMQVVKRFAQTYPGAREVVVVDSGQSIGGWGVMRHLQVFMR